MKFKVGDKVKFVNNLGMHGSHVKLNEIFKIINIDSYENNIMPYHAKNEIGYGQWFREEELELVEYTYEDLKKAPIGTKVTFENGEKLIKCSVKRYENENRWRYEKDFVKMEDKYKTLGKITKIEEPTYQTVYETKVDILGEAEKRYLKQVIRPYKNIKSIAKYIYPGRRIASIMITILDLDNEDWTFTLPPFKVGNMYKNMKDNKIYTIEELGL